MRLFLIISISLLISGCATYSKKNNLVKIEDSSSINNPYFANQEKDYIYKANIEVYNKNFGGVFIIKKISDLNHRVVFTTEMGNKLFDFSFIGKAFKVNYILDAFDKKILINVLKKDFKVLITESLPVIDTYNQENKMIKRTEIENKTHYYYYETTGLQKVVRANHKKENVVFLFNEITENTAQQIEIIHSNIKLKIHLKAFN